MRKSTVQDARDTLTDLPIFFSRFSLLLVLASTLGSKIAAASIPTNNIETPSAAQLRAEKKIRDVANLYERQFLRDMVRQMRSTVSYSELSKPSFAEGYFREQLDQEYVEKWGDRGGIGLADMIYKQLVDQYGDRMGIKARMPRQKKGPFPLK